MFDLSRSQRGTPHDVWRRFHTIALAAGLGFATFGAIVLALVAPLPLSTSYWVDVAKSAFLIAAGAVLAVAGARGLRAPGPAMLKVDDSGFTLTLSNGVTRSVRWADPNLQFGLGQLKHAKGKVVDALVCRELTKGVQHDLIYLFPEAASALRRGAVVHGLPQEEARFAHSGFGWTVDGGTRFGRIETLPSGADDPLPFPIGRSELRLRTVAEGGVPMLLIVGLTALVIVGVLGWVIAWATRSWIATGTLVVYGSVLGMVSLLLGDYLSSGMSLRPVESTWSLENQGLVYRETKPPRSRRGGWRDGRSFLFQLPVKDIRSDRTWDWKEFEITAMGVWGATKVDQTKVQLSFRPKEWRTGLPKEPSCVVPPPQAKAVLLVARSRGCRTIGTAGVLETITRG